DMFDMMTLTEALVAHALEHATGGTRIVYQGEAVDFRPPWRRLSMLDAVGEAVGESVRDLDVAKLEGHARRRHVATRRGASRGGLLAALFSEVVQPQLRQPTLVIDHPIETSPLARVSRANPAVVERFELFVVGMELANAFSEQNDPRAQTAAF